MEMKVTETTLGHVLLELPGQSCEVHPLSVSLARMPSHTQTSHSPPDSGQVLALQSISMCPYASSYSTILREDETFLEVSSDGSALDQDCSPLSASVSSSVWWAPQSGLPPEHRV